NNSFDLGGGGTLVISNGASTFVNFNGDVTATGGTIIFNSAAGQVSQMNYANSGHNFINGSTDTIVGNGAGTNTIIGNFSGNNQWFQNSGTIIVNGGIFTLDPRDANTN